MQCGTFLGCFVKNAKPTLAVPLLCRRVERSLYGGGKVGVALAYTPLAFPEVGGLHGLGQGGTSSAARLSV